MRARSILVSLGLLLVALIIQTTLISRFRFVTPDLMMLLTIIFALTSMRREMVLLLGFGAGLVVDLLSSTVMGLRAAVFTVLAFIAVRTAQRADAGPVVVAIWVGLLTLLGVVLFLLVGTLFGQGGLITTDLARRVIFVPLTNLALSFLVAPMVIRLIDGKRRGLL
ncbi:MAG: rod shape-determining protein MreD [Acidimicrobiia bacterium]